jgi:hypothetical protein
MSFLRRKSTSKDEQRSGNFAFWLHTPLLGLVVPAVLVAQLNPNPSIFNQPPFNRTPRPAPTAPAGSGYSAYPQPQAPDVVMTPVNGKVNIQFVNNTGATIDYQVIGDTEYRHLAGRAGMTLQGLPTPTSFTFRRQDNGFLQVTLGANDPTTGTLTVNVRETPSFAADRTTIYIDQAGGVFLN